MTRKVFFGVISILASIAAAQDKASIYPPAQLLEHIQPAGIRSHIEFLADDLLEGRGTGARGYMLAAKYIATQFEGMGLKPAGVGGTYFQNVRLRRIDSVPEKTSLTVKMGGKERVLTIDQDFTANGDPLLTDTVVEAPVVFVGYGVSAPEFHYDDYNDVNVKGKIVAFVYGAPSNFPSAPRAHYSTGTVKSANAAAHGAIGMLQIWAGPISKRVPFSQLVHFSHGINMRWLDDKGMPNDAQPEVRGRANISAEAAGPMFAGAAKSFKDAVDSAVANKPQAFPLQATVALHIVCKHSEVEAPNIAAILPGSDPQLSKQYVVYTAHADHMGIGEPVNGDVIYNGAMDNASGTSALLEIARALSSAPQAPRRSSLFVAVTAEEEGLLGSDYYAQHPTVPIGDIIANVNMDEISFHYDFRDMVALGSEHSSIGTTVEDVAKHMGLEISPDPAPEEVFFVRSDQYSFVKQGVPAVAVFEGYKAVDPKIDGKKLGMEFEEKYYHSPKDDLSQPNLDFAAAVKATRINLAIGYELSQQDDRPAWNKGDFFVRFVKK